MRKESHRDFTTRRHIAHVDKAASAPARRRAQKTRATQSRPWNSTRHGDRARSIGSAAWRLTEVDQGEHEYLRMNHLRMLNGSDWMIMMRRSTSRRSKQVFTTWERRIKTTERGICVALSTADWRGEVMRRRSVFLMLCIV